MPPNGSMQIIVRATGSMHFFATLIFNALSIFAVGVLVIGPDSVMSGTVISDLVVESGLRSSMIGKVAAKLLKLINNS